MFTSKAKKEETKESPFITPGVHEVKITDITPVEKEGKAPYLNIKFETLDNTKSVECMLFMSEASLNYSLETIDYILSAIDYNQEVSGKDLDQYAKNLLKAVKNKPFRHRFVGEQVAGGINKETGEQKRAWMKAKMGRKYSCESISTNPSRLKPLDITNPYDWKLLPVADNITTVKNSSDDLPF